MICHKASRSTWSIALPLSPQAVHVLHRRSRRRLRALGECSGARVQLDDTTGIIFVSGPGAAVIEVQRQLMSLDGPFKEVSVEVWVELLRTRSNKDAGCAREGLLAWLQRSSGCHVHVERMRPEVRLFGTDLEMQEASALLDWLASICCGKSMEVPPAVQSLDPAVLDALAKRCGVSLHMSPGRITALGLRAAVSDAIGELKERFAQPSSNDVDALSHFPGALGHKLGKGGDDGQGFPFYIPEPQLRVPSDSGASTAGGKKIEELPVYVTSSLSERSSSKSEDSLVYVSASRERTPSVSDSGSAESEDLPAYITAMSLEYLQREFQLHEQAPRVLRQD